jgi:hypothetical protein
MGSAYNGIPGNIGFPASLTITLATNVNPIVVTTGPAHGMMTGDRVDVVGVLGNTAANGVWTVTRLSANTFSIPVAGNGAYTSGGTAQPLTYGAATTLPSDGTDPRNAASVNVPFESILDRSSSLVPTIGSLKLCAQYIIAQVSGNTASPPTVWAKNATSVTGYAAMVLPGGGPLTFSSIPYISGADILEVTLDGTIAVDVAGATTGVTAVALGIGFGPYGGSSGTPALYGKYVDYPGSGVTAYAPATLKAWTSNGTYSDGSTTGQAFVFLYSNTFGVTSAVNMVGDYTLIARVWRSTGVPQ